MFDEDENTYKKQIKIIKERNVYEKHKKITPELIRNEAIFYDTPYPVFNYVYSEEIGLYKIKLLENIGLILAPLENN